MFAEKNRDLLGLEMTVYEVCAVKNMGGTSVVRVVESGERGDGSNGE